MSDKRLRKCPECKRLKLHQLFSVPSRYIGPQTIGSLAEKNAAGMSEDAKDHLIQQSQTKRPQSKKSFKTPPPERKFDREKMNRIAKASKEKKEKYIAGEINSI